MATYYGIELELCVRQTQGGEISLVKPIDFMIPVNPNFATIPSGLANAHLIEADGTFNNNTASLLDSWCPLWQQQTLLYYVSPSYTGNIEIDSIISLYPFSIDIGDLVSNYSIVLRNPLNNEIYEISLSGFTGGKFCSALSSSWAYAAFFCTNNDGSRLWDGKQTGQMTSTRGAYIFPSSTYTHNTVLPAYLWGISSDYKPKHQPSKDPYAPGGTSGPGGGGGTHSDPSEPIPIPGLPTLSAVDAGFITLFNPSVAELNNLASYMWSSSAFDPNTWRKIFANPIDAILGLTIVPVTVPNAGQYEVVVGDARTGVYMNRAATQYVSVDCGSLNIAEFWGAYLDYDPYTKIEIYLPYIGTHPLAVDDIMGKTIQVVYNVDILSGACVAMIKAGDSVLYNFVGQCSCSIPITGNDMTNVINGSLTIAAAIGTMIASGGAAAPVAGAAVAAASAAVNQLKPTVEKSGSMGGMGGMLGIQYPYIIITRPRQALPESQNTFDGYPSLITKTLGDVTGYTVVESVHLENVPCTDAELSEIISLLKSGVII